MYTISDETKKRLEETFGMSLEEYKKMSADEEREWVMRKTCGKVSFGARRRSIEGNPLLSQGKMRTMEDVDRKSRELIGLR